MIKSDDEIKETEQVLFTDLKESLHPPVWPICPPIHVRVFVRTPGPQEVLQTLHTDHPLQ